MKIIIVATKPEYEAIKSNFIDEEKYCLLEGSGFDINCSIDCESCFNKYFSLVETSSEVTNETI